MCHILRDIQSACPSLGCLLAWLPFRSLHSPLLAVCTCSLHLGPTELVYPPFSMRSAKSPPCTVFCLLGFEVFFHPIFSIVFFFFSFPYGVFSFPFFWFIPAFVCLIFPSSCLCSRCPFFPDYLFFPVPVVRCVREFLKARTQGS